MNTTFQTLDELFDRKVREATQSVLNDIVRKIEQQQKEISGLKEDHQKIRALLKSWGVKIAPARTVRTSPHDIRVFRKRFGITQEVFAFMLEVNRRTVIRWEKGLCRLSKKKRKLLTRLKTMSRTDLEQEIKTANHALYN